MTFLELVQFAMAEAGITSTDVAPTTLTDVDGIQARFKSWVQQAWDEIKIENDIAEFKTAWFSVTLNPRFYFDLSGTSMDEVFAGDTLVGSVTGCTFDVTRVQVMNNGLWADGTAQGFIEFENATGYPMDSEILTTAASGNDSCRFIKWGDYRLDDETEMGAGWIDNLEDVWWQSLKVQDCPLNSPPTITPVPLPYLNYAKFMESRFNVGPSTLGTPRFVTETPDDGTRIAFWPPIDRPYRISGDYYKTIAQLEEDDDEPTGLKSLYHPMIAWRAVRYYAEYDAQPMILAEALKRYSLYKKKMDRENEIPVSFSPVRLY